MCNHRSNLPLIPTSPTSQGLQTTRARTTVQWPGLCTQTHTQCKPTSLTHTHTWCHSGNINSRTEHKHMQTMQPGSTGTHTHTPHIHHTPTLSTFHFFFVSKLITGCAHMANPEEKINTLSDKIKISFILLFILFGFPPSLCFLSLFPSRFPQSTSAAS